MNSHRIVRWDNGKASIADAEGRAMHSRIGPEAEARSVYLEPSRLSERLAQSASSPLLLLDVGMGLATNALTVIDEVQRLARMQLQNSIRAVQIESFETTLEGVELALASLDDPAFQWLRPHEEKLRTLLRQGLWTDEASSLSWRLHVGDFRDQLKRLSDHSAELVFFDFYAPKTCPELWSPELFTELRTKVSENHGLLLTYSSATPVRAALLLAGWFVGAGASTSAKLDTTLASPTVEGLPNGSLLGDSWRRKLDTSTQVAPQSLLARTQSAQERHELDSKIRERLRHHPQWMRVQDSVG